jgi:hypothetical protein
MAGSVADSSSILSRLLNQGEVREMRAALLHSQSRQRLPSTTTKYENENLLWRKLDRFNHSLDAFIDCQCSCHCLQYQLNGCISGSIEALPSSNKGDDADTLWSVKAMLTRSGVRTMCSSVVADASTLAGSSSLETFSCEDKR